MNKWIKRIVALSFVVAQFLVIPTVSASSLENIRSEKNAVEEEVTQLQQEVNNGLEEVSEISAALDQLNNEIEEHKATIADTEEDIEAQEILVQERYEYTAEQLKAMQKSEVNQNIILSVLQAESLSDLFNKIYSASVLTGASEERLVEAQTEQEKLDAMKETLLVNQEELDSKQTRTVEQKETLDTKVAELSSTLASNQDQLAELNSEESAELRRIAEAEEAAAQKVAEQEAAEQRQAEEEQEEQNDTVTVASSSSNSANESNNSNNSNNSNESNESKQSNESSSSNNSSSSNESSKSNNSNKQSETNDSKASESNSAGEWMSFQATGYSTQQPGLSTHTATGIDLRVNSQVIAVDPSVIPLGSLVEVQGLGVYVAGDTGGAINGRIIDIHYPTVSQALSWGRRSVNIRVLN